MAHRHVIGMLMTGPDVPDPNGGHYHIISGSMLTSSNEEGPKHTHTFEDKTTSGPLPILRPDKGSTDQVKKKRKTRKKSSPKKTGWS